MNILIVSQFYFPEQFQINEIAPELARRGHSVTVVCGQPNYPQGRIYVGYEHRFEEMIDGVRVLRCKNVPRGHNPLSLLCNYFSFKRNATDLVESLEGDFDVVLSYQLSPVTMAFPAIRYKTLHRKPLLLYCLDIWPESGYSHLPFSKGPVHSYLAWLSRKAYSRCDRILVTSRPFIRYLNRTNGIPENKMGYLPQHASAEMLSLDMTTEENGITDFMYAGNMGAGQRLDVIIKAAAILGSRKDYKIHFVGDGSKREELESMAHTMGLRDNIIFYGNQKRSDMPSYYRKADVLLITLRGNNAVGDTMPGKLQMYMTTGKPIIGAINGASKEVIEESQCGAAVAAGDYEGLAHLMEDYMEHPEKYSECGKNGRKYFRRHFMFDKYMDGLETELKTLITK